MPPILHACSPSSDSVAIFSRYNDSRFECVLESIPERAETIYQECNRVVNEILRRYSQQRMRPELEELYLEDENGNRMDISAHLPTFWETLLERLERAGWITQVVYLALLVGVAFTFTSLLTTVYIGLIGLLAAVLASILQAWWDTRHRKLQWRVG